MGNLIYNEKVKLTATFLNNFGIAIFVACALIPAISLQGKPELALLWAITFVAGSFVAIVIHLLAVRMLGALRE
jgi:hypothetical protein